MSKKKTEPRKPSEPWENLDMSQVMKHDTDPLPKEKPPQDLTPEQAKVISDKARDMVAEELHYHDPKTESLIQPAEGGPSIEVAVTKSYVVDFDDFSQANHELELIQRLLRIPGYKITLFTIPGQTTIDWLRDIAKIDGLELALHGQHHTHLECVDWSEEKTLNVLKHYEGWGIFQKIFKAPYWELTAANYRGILKSGWALADHVKNKGRAPKGIPIYYMHDDVSVHGHIGDVCGNGIRQKFDYYASLRGDFHFISEIIAHMRIHPEAYENL